MTGRCEGPMPEREPGAAHGVGHRRRPGWPAAPGGPCRSAAPTCRARSTRWPVRPGPWPPADRPPPRSAYQRLVNPSASARCACSTILSTLEAPPVSPMRMGGTLSGVAAGGYSPVTPSMASRSRSTWPLCRAVSSIMWSVIQRRVKGWSVSRSVPTDRWSSDPAAVVGDPAPGAGLGVLGEQVLGSVVGRAVVLPVGVGVPVHARPGLGHAGPREAVGEPGVLDQGQVLDQPARW